MNELSEHLHRYGYVRLFAVAPGETTLEIAQRYGVVSDIPGISRVQELVPRATNQASLSSYGGMYGLDAFPLHTDMAHWHIPPRYFLLRCVAPALQVDTFALHFRAIVGDESEATLRRAIFRPRRRLEGRLTPLRIKEGDRFRWDPIFIVPVTEEAKRLRERMIFRMSTIDVEKIALRTRMDCVLFDNWNAAHGRTAVPPEAMHRRVERVYLDSLNP